jgi:1-aminocyclopropane-1-carboxylate deaminase
VEQNIGTVLLPEKIVSLRAITTNAVYLPAILNGDITMDILRLDKMDSVISGNKWFKLRVYLEEALTNKEALLTFGGAYSNHILAAACAAARCGLRSIGIIRGEKPPQLSPTLLDAAGLGMQLIFIGRQEYNQKNDPAFIQQLQKKFGFPCIIPEGGQGITGVKGASAIHDFIKKDYYTHIACATGTGTMLAGLAARAGSDQQLIGIHVLKGLEHWKPPVTPGIATGNISLVHDYHFGGYAKKNDVLLDFMNEWYLSTGIPSDFVYTGKLFYGIMDMIKKNYFPAKSRVLVIHSGGLQGNRSLPPKSLVF